MKKFTITETRPSTHTRFYEVEAESEEEAFEKVMEGLEPSIDTYIEIDYDNDDVEYEVIEHK